jgi:hypothetical protein
MGARIFPSLCLEFRWVYKGIKTGTSLEEMFDKGFF